MERVGAFQLASEIGTLQRLCLRRRRSTAYITWPSSTARFGDGSNGVLARLHRADVIGDVFGGAQAIRASLARFKAAGRGVIVYLRDGTAGVPVAEIPHMATPEPMRPARGNGAKSDSARRSSTTSAFPRSGLLTSSKRTYVVSEAFGIEICRRPSSIEG